ncbi:hypothetical protein DL89DRAFT_263838 [Linderina pennispora]|uniref:Uncharacterized protein n=1 Tax=Linderina pennispora TaxID=61395 RepID=A0A1Y1WKC9_9FUNG|nr:uncharacterized protein DL89DRAFT_263838 [Linderina pennispora]ORX73825.1 hypothetical protein DL89DRAFT_263838 [Linderina pennispora]
MFRFAARASAAVASRAAQQQALGNAGRRIRQQHRRTFMAMPSFRVGDNSWRTPVVVISAALGLSTIGFFAFSTFFGPGSKYPGDVRKLLREGGMAYLRTADKQDLPKAVDAWVQSDPEHSRDAPHITGLVARIAAVYHEMGDLENTVRLYKDLLSRILGDDGMADPHTQVRVLLDEKQPKDKRENTLRALGCANKLAETYEERAMRSKRRSALLADPDLASHDVQEASRWYQWCLQVVMLAYQNHYNHLQLEKKLPLTNTPSFDPDTLPKFLSVEVVTSLFYNAAAFFSTHAQYGFAVPLLQRALDLLRRGADGTETGVCRSSVLMSHLANAAVMTSNLPAAEKWAIDGLALAKRFPQNADCLNSFVALTYNLGAVYEAANKHDDARVQYRQAIEVAKVTDDSKAQELATEALNRVAK